MNATPRRRKPNRLAGYDYSRAGAYFITICTHKFQRLFGEIDGDRVHLSPYGELVRICWEAIPQHNEYVRLDEYVIMPNHVHGILWLTESQNDNQNDVGARYISPLPENTSVSTGTAPGTLGAVVGQFKAAVTRAIHRLSDEDRITVWQRNFYDHIVRSERTLYLIRRYINENPRRWSLDKYNPQSTGLDADAVEIWRQLNAIE